MTAKAPAAPAAKDAPVPFQSKATIIYRGGSGHPFPPGSKVSLPKSHADALTAVEEQAADRAQERETKRKADENLAKAQAEEAAATEAAAKPAIAQPDVA